VDVLAPPYGVVNSTPSAFQARDQRLTERLRHDHVGSLLVLRAAREDLMRAARSRMPDTRTAAQHGGVQAVGPSKSSLGQVRCTQRMLCTSDKIFAKPEPRTYAL